jgi:hypothetical protein
LAQRVAAHIESLRSGLTKETVDRFFRGVELDGFFTMKRLAIHREDIAKYKLPPQRVKASDSRAADFVREWGSHCVELDALAPRVLRQRVRAAIRSKLDLVKWQRAVAVEQAEVQSIDRMAETMRNLPRAEQ